MVVDLVGPYQYIFQAAQCRRWYISWRLTKRNIVDCCVDREMFVGELDDVLTLACASLQMHHCAKTSVYLAYIITRGGSWGG